MSKSLTTLIDVEINRKILDSKFDLYKVIFSSDMKQQSYSKRLAKIDKHVSPLGLISHSKHYWIVLHADSSMPLKLPDISFVKISFLECDDLLVTRLLTRTLGKLAGEQVFSGLGETYFYLEPDTYKKQTIHKCVSIDLHESIRFGSIFIVLKGNVFCPTDIVFKSPLQIEQAPKFSFDLTTGLLNRDANGSFMIYSPGKGNFTSNAIDISGQKPISLRKSKTGALHHYINLMNKVFNGFFKIKLKPLTADWRKHYGNSEIKNIYKKIYELVNQAGGIRVVNASLSNDGVEKLMNEIWPVDVSFISVDEVKDNNPLLVILDSKEDYENAGLSDKKQDFYSHNKATQSVYNKTVMSKDSKSIQVLIDNWVKEIAVKLECTNQKFMIQNFCEKFWFISIEQKYQKDSPIFHVLKCNNGEFVYESHDEFYFEELGIELPEKQRYFEEINYVIDMSKDEPLVCSIIHEGIAAVPDATVLFEILNRLNEGNIEGMTRDYIDIFLSENDESQDPLISRLYSLLEKFPNKTEFYKDDLKNGEIKYRSNAEKLLFDGYFEQTGVLLNYSLKGQHNEYLESQTGHFYDEGHSAYFVGMPKGGFKFSRGQFNHIRFLEGPDYLKQKCVEMTATYYIKNKSATVLPFPFKTLSECVELNNTVGV